MKIVLYTKNNCNFCDRAKELLADHAIPFREEILDLHFSRDYIKQLYPQATTYPVVVVDGFNIGGFTELRSHLTEQFASTKQLLNEGL